MGTVDSEDGPARGRLRSRAGGLSGLSGVALAAGGSAGSDAGPGSASACCRAAGACDDAGALLGVVGAACQVGTAVLPRPPPPTGPGTANGLPGASAASCGALRRGAAA